MSNSDSRRVGAPQTPLGSGGTIPEITIRYASRYFVDAQTNLDYQAKIIEA